MQLFLYELSHNAVLWTAIAAWFVAQVIKFTIEIVTNKHFSLYVLLLSTGGMPSSHTAFVTSMAVMVGFHEGFASSMFALALVFSMVTMADAAGVRRAAGKQAAVLNMLIENLNNPNISIDQKLRELLGHTPVEVAAGALLGVAMGVAMGVASGHYFGY